MGRRSAFRAWCTRFWAASRTLSGSRRRRLSGLPNWRSLWNGLGDALLAKGRNAEAVDALKRAIALQPGYGPALERLELAHVRLGEHEWRWSSAPRPQARRASASGPICWMTRRKNAAPPRRSSTTSGASSRTLLRQAEQTDPFAEPYLTRTTADRIVVVYAALGEWHQAMDWVERAYDRRPVRLRRLLTEPLFDRRGLAVDPRYARLLRAAVMEELM